MKHPAAIEIIRSAEPIIRLAGELIGDPQRKGGCLCVSRPGWGIILVCHLGEVASRESADRYFSFCQEKVRRLAANEGNLSSWQSRDPENKKYGGGIRLEDGMICAFSGLPELWDEACMVALALTLSGQAEPTAYLRKILETSQNPHGARLISACR